MTAPLRDLAGTCTFALRMGDGRYLMDPEGLLATSELRLAHLWLWPLGESDEARAAQIAAVRKAIPWVGPLTAVRARP